uniref:ATP-grasp domain-containing protein n=1 Tax=Alexandrium monilatum TaxID=311494 RepID=A0A7S4SNW7_9DINO
MQPAAPPRAAAVVHGGATICWAADRREAFPLPRSRALSLRSLLARCPARLERRPSVSTAAASAAAAAGAAAGAGISRSAAARRRRRRGRRVARAVLDPSEFSDPIAFCPPPASPDTDYPEWDLPDYPDMDYWPEMDLQSGNERIAEKLEEGDWEGAVKCLEDMRSYGVSPDVDSYYMALRACRNGGLGREAHDLIEDMWRRDLDPDSACYTAAIGACVYAEEEEYAQELRGEFREWGMAPDAERFQLVPGRLSWTRPLRKMGCSARNTLVWNGRHPLPPPPPAAAPVWLLPAQDDAAVHIAELQLELREAGWKVLSCNPALVDRLRNKAAFRRYAESLGLVELLPVHYDSAKAAQFPCILKPAMGTWGKDTHIVRSAEEVENLARSELGAKWVLQELVPGRLEYSTSLLVSQGEILDAVCTRYEYSKEEYVWPNNVEEVANDHCSVPAAHLDAMHSFLKGFSGICNFNYKLRASGDMCIFEVNPRVGGDLAFDVPRPRARALFEKLDAMF